MKKIGFIKAEIITDKLLKKNFKRDYSFFARNKPEIFIRKKLPQINFSPQFKFSIIFQEDRYLANKQEKDDKFVNIYKSKSVYFPRSIGKI